MRSPREAVLLALALLLQACSATRAYEGPVRPKEELARITTSPDSVSDVVDIIGRGLTFDSLCRVRLVGVDDVEDFDDFSDGSVEVLPGHHSVRATLTARIGWTWTRHPAFVASFDAQAGHEYKLQGRASSLTGEVGFDVRDVGDDLIVASSDLGPQECVTARIEWDGRHWIEADWGHLAAVTTATYVPSGDVLSRWSELVELQYRPSRGPVDVEAVMWDWLKEQALAGAPATLTRIEREPGWIATQLSIGEPGDGLEQGVICFRAGPDGCHLLLHLVRGRIDPTVVADWIARFKAAELRPTAA